MLKITDRLVPLPPVHWGLVLCVIFLIAQPGSSRADDAICVVCKAPDLTYRCKVMRDDGTMASGSFDFFCIKEIAREGVHKSCSVRRSGPEICEGLQKTLVYNGAPRKRPQQDNFTQDPGARLDPNGSPNGNVVGEGTSRDTDADTDKAGEPKTMYELTDKAVKGSKKQLKKTGVAIGGAAKKTGDAVVGAVKKTGQTITRAVKNTGAKVGGAVKKTGKAIGGAAKSTLNCVTSLFSNCF